MKGVTKKELLASVFEGGLSDPQDDLEVVERQKEKLSLSDQELRQALQLKIPYSIDWAIKLFRYCEKGNSVEAFCGKHMISPTQVEAWKSNSEWEEALKMAKAAEILYWEQKLAKVLEGSSEDEAVDPDFMKICKFKLENLGYRSKLSENNKVLFKDQTNKNKKKMEMLQETRKDALEVTEDKIDSLMEALEVVHAETD